MAECRWNPEKHGGKPCPVHGGAGSPGAGGHKIRINQGKYEARTSDDADWEEVSPEEYEDLKEGGYAEFDENEESDFGDFDEYDGEGLAFNKKEKISEEEFDKKFAGFDIEEMEEDGQKLKLAYDEDGNHVGTYNITEGVMYYDDEVEDNHLAYEEVFTGNDNSQIERYAEKYGIDASELKDEIHQDALDRIRQGDSVTNAKNDAMEEVLGRLAEGPDNSEMKVDEPSEKMKSDYYEWPEDKDQPAEGDLIRYGDYDDDFYIVKDKDGQFTLRNNVTKEEMEVPGSDLIEKGYDIIHSHKEKLPEPEDSEPDLEDSLDTLIDLVPEEQREEAKKIKEKILGNKRKA